MTDGSEGDAHLHYESKVQQLPLKMSFYVLLNTDAIALNSFLLNWEENLQRNTIPFLNLQ